MALTRYPVTKLPMLVGFMGPDLGTSGYVRSIHTVEENSQTYFENDVLYAFLLRIQSHSFSQKVFHLEGFSLLFTSLMVLLTIHVRKEVRSLVHHT